MRDADEWQGSSDILTLTNQPTDGGSLLFPAYKAGKTAAITAARDDVTGKHQEGGNDDHVTSSSNDFAAYLETLALSQDAGPMPDIGGGNFSCFAFENRAPAVAYDAYNGQVEVSVNSAGPSVADALASSGPADMTKQPAELGCSTAAADQPLLHSWDGQTGGSSWEGADNDVGETASSNSAVVSNYCSLFNLISEVSGQPSQHQLAAAHGGLTEETPSLLDTSRPPIHYESLADTLAIFNDHSGIGGAPIGFSDALATFQEQDLALDSGLGHESSCSFVEALGFSLAL